MQAIHIPNTEYFFIHIPKNAGTSFIKQYCNDDQKGHWAVRDLNIDPKKTVAIVRNPYDRLVSVYEYNKMKENYWHSFSNKTKYGIAPLYDFCSKHDFGDFVEAVTTGKLTNNHLQPQYTWVLTRDNKVETKIAKLENLNEDMTEILQTKIELGVVNKSDRKKDWNEYYTKELKEKVYNFYKLDFLVFKYEK